MEEGDRILRELVLCERVAAAPFSCRDYIAGRLRGVRAPERISKKLREIANADTTEEMAALLRSYRKALSGKTVCSAKQHLLNPAFNIHEIRKNALLFQDHLSSDDKYCPECLNKHALLMEAFADEALGLDSDGKWRQVLLSVLPRIALLRQGLNDSRMNDNTRRAFIREAVSRVLAGLPPT